MEKDAKWIWKPGDARPVNEHVCFRKTFDADLKGVHRAVLTISADTRYRVWLNGRELGDGPIRSTTGAWYYDSYEVLHLLRDGHNTIAVKAWHFGHSNYQYVEAQAGLVAQIRLEAENGVRLIPSDETWKQHVHEAFEQHVVKRNVNLGWMEIYDASRWSEEWTQLEYDDGDWGNSVVVANCGDLPWGELLPRDMPHPSTQVIFPRQAVSLEEVQPIKQVVSLNLRDNFFPGARDANAKIFSGIVAVELEVPSDASGTITFAHSPWNGVQGRFKIGPNWHKQHDPIRLSAGRHFFLMEICGIHNDLFTHIEFQFEEEVRFVHPFSGMSESSEQPAFVTAGPFQVIEPVADGHHPVYGGVEKSTGLDKDLPVFRDIRECSSSEQLMGYRSLCTDVQPCQVLRNQMIYSLMLRKRIERSYPVTRSVENLLYAHPHPTELGVPQHGGDLELTLDFGKIYVGRIAFELEAPEGAVFDFYGFEHRHEGANRYTSGCNNAFRYISRGGRQTFASETRMGLRYLLMAVRNQTAPVRVFNIRLLQSSYPATDHAAFRCSDALLNDIWEISRHTSHMCMEDTFTDCPTYEQVFWVGDCRVSALVNYNLFGSYELVKHCLRMVPRSRGQSPLLLALMPTDWQAAIPMWTFSWMLACREYVQYSGDSDFIVEIYPEIKRTLDDYMPFVNEKGLFDISSWNLLDWAPLDVPYAGVVTGQQALLAKCSEIAAEMAGRLGHTEERDVLTARCRRLKEALHRHLWDEERAVYLDGIHRTGTKSSTVSLQTHVLLYLTDCLDDSVRAAIEAKLVHPPDDWVKIGTPFFSFYLFEVWQKMGRLNEILDQIRRDWGLMIRHGSTTCWETFQVFPRSMAHAWSTAPAFVMGMHVLGIQMREEGFRKIRLSPPEIDLEWVEGALPTPFGRIESSWSKSKEQIKPVWRLTVPEAIEVEMEPALAEEWEIRLHRVGSIG